jgi:hypothetical protein
MIFQSPLKSIRNGANPAAQNYEGNNRLAS